MAWWGRALAAVALVMVLGLLGGMVFQAGMATGAAQAVASGGAGAVAAAPMMAYGWHPYGLWHFGFGPFGFLIPLLFVFFMVNLMRFVFWGGRHRRWGHGHDAFDRERGMQRIREMHEELHRGGGAAPSTGPSDHGQPFS